MTIKKDIIGIILTKDMVNSAEQKAKKQGVLKKSMKKEEGNLVGYIGEEVVKRYIKAEECNTYDHDLLYNSMTIDVKTKRTGAIPKVHYPCSIPSYVINAQHPDIYVFVYFENDKEANRHIGWIVGWIEKKGFLKKSTFHKQGEKDSSLKKGFTFNCDTYNIKISDLKPIDNLVKLR